MKNTTNYALNMWDYDLPFEVFLDALLPLLSLTDICILTQVNVGWRDMCSDDKMWKILYMRTNPGKILDTSVHIGPRGGKDRRHRDRHAEYEIYRKTSVISKPLYSSAEPFTPSSTRRSKTSEEFLNRSWCCGCMPQDLKDNLQSWSDIRTDGVTDDTFGYRPATWGSGRLRDTTEYSRYVQDSWRTYNEERGLSTRALCQNPDHYNEETLGISEECKRLKSYKEAALVRMRKKIKKENQKRIREQKKAEKDFEKAYAIMVEMKKRMVVKTAWVEKGEKTLDSLECALKK